MKDFRKEFYWLSNWLAQIHEGEVVVIRYVNGLNYAIQDELILLNSREIKESYKLAFKEEEKLSRKTSKSRGKLIYRSQKYSFTR